MGNKGDENGDQGRRRQKTTKEEGRKQGKGRWGPGKREVRTMSEGDGEK